MNIKIKRDIFTTKCTMGILTIDDDHGNKVFQCYTLEDVARASGVKIYGQTAIPAGGYSMIINRSSRFKINMPLLYNSNDLSVRDDHGVTFEGIRIHSGNTDADTDGCILLGMKRGENAVFQSRDAVRAFMMHVTEWDQTLKAFRAFDKTREPIHVFITNNQSNR